MITRFLTLLFLLTSSSLICQPFADSKDLKTIENALKMGDSIKLIDKGAALSIFKKGLAIALDGGFNSEAALFYKKIGVLYHQKNEYENACNMYILGTKRDSTSINTADLFYNISLIKNKLNQQDSSLFYLRQSVKLYERFEWNESALKAFLRAGVVYKDLQLYEQALGYSLKAYEGFLKFDNELKLADACTIIGNIQNQIGNYNQALEYHLQALNLNVKLKNNVRTGICYTNIANVHDNLKAPDSAIVNYRKALNFFNNETGQYAIVLNNLATTYKDINNFDLAEKYFGKSIKVNQSLNDTTSLMYNYNGLTSLYLNADNLKQARIYLEKSKNLISSITDNHTILGFYENQANYFKKTGNYQVALEFQIKHSNLYKELYNADNAEIVQRLQANFEYEKKENEILKLNLENKSANALLQEKTKNIRIKNLWILILAIIILLLAILYYAFLQRQKTSVQKEKIEKLKAIYQGQESIKKRIARDLHDIITTNFDGLRLKILALKRSTKVDEMVEDISKELKLMNQQIRTVSHRLYPLEMYMGKQKFTDIIKSRLSEFQLYSNIFVELETQLPDQLNHANLTVQNNFYGILLEILNNVEKHSLATKIQINNYIDKTKNLHFSFEDNGIGIDHKHKEGIGLMNIKQRVEILEGSCSISKIETGTRVHVKFPLIVRS